MTADTLYFAQHGLAVTKAEDSERSLSKEGSTQTRVIADYLSTLNTRISNIFHSNKLRSLQTAQIFSSSLNVTNILEIDHLSPNDDIHLLKKNLTISQALYIGHLPHIDKLVSLLVCGDQTANILNMQNSAVACLKKSGAFYQVDWYLPYRLVETNN